MGVDGGGVAGGGVGWGVRGDRPISSEQLERQLAGCGRNASRQVGWHGRGGVEAWGRMGWSGGGSKLHMQAYFIGYIIFFYNTICNKYANNRVNI